jgi:hypothetical protein
MGTVRFITEGDYLPTGMSNQIGAANSRRAGQWGRRRFSVVTIAFPSPSPAAVADLRR